MTGKARMPAKIVLILFIKIEREHEPTTFLEEISGEKQSDPWL